MSEASAAADQVTKEAIQLAEAAAKLSAAGLKNLAALALALSKDKSKLRGKTSLSKLLREGSELRVIPLPKEKIEEFHTEAKRYGIVFATIQENKDGTVDHLVRAQDAAKINRVFERIDYHGLEAHKAEQKNQEKKFFARAVSENDLSLCGQETHSQIQPPQTQSMENWKETGEDRGGKINVRQKIEHLRKEQKQKQNEKSFVKKRSIPKGKER